MNAAEYFARFFEEKNLPCKTWEIEHDGTVHFINSDVVIEAIKGTTGSEASKIATILRKIDFANGDVYHFLRHLAEALVFQS